MQRQVRLRYANEMAGAFVLVATALFIAAIVLTGRSQRWLEGHFKLYTSFDTKEGAFGLQEGNDIRVRNTVAGRVGRVEPTPDGNMTATLVIKDGFRQFIYKNSVGHISTKMHGVGASFIEIMPPPENERGELIGENDFIACVKDEELIDQATKIMTQVEEIVLPMTRDLARITQSIRQGEGLVGAMVMDPDLAKTVEDALRQTDTFVTEVRELVRQSTRAIKAAQKSILLRGHMDEEDAPGYVVPVSIAARDSGESVRGYEKELDLARQADNSADIIESAHNLAVCYLERNEYGQVEKLLAEIRQEAREAGGEDPRVTLLEAEMARRRGDAMRADFLTAEALKSTPRSAPDVQLLGWIVQTENYCDAADAQGALAAAKKVAALYKRAEAPALRSMASKAQGRAAALAGNWLEAAGHFDAQAASLREARLYTGMALALETAADANERAGRAAAAADRYYRAGRTLFHGGDPEGAAVPLKRALAAAKECGNKFLSERIAEMMEPTAEDPGDGTPDRQ